MSCKLYYKYGKSDYYLGEFKDRPSAEKHWNLIKTMLESKMGSGIEPIYVESIKRKNR